MLFSFKPNLIYFLFLVDSKEPTLGTYFDLSILYHDIVLFPQPND